jgi:hypothetical protein
LEPPSLPARTPDAYRSRRVCDANWRVMVRFCSRRRRATAIRGCGGEVPEPLSFRLSAIGSMPPNLSPLGATSPVSAFIGQHACIDQERLSGLSLLRSLYVLNQSSHAWSKAKRFTPILISSSFSSYLPHNINKVPLPVFRLSTAVIEERCKECSENMVLSVTEYMSRITATRSGREIMNTENRATPIDKIRNSWTRTAATRKTAPTTK